MNLKKIIIKLLKVFARIIIIILLLIPIFFSIIMYMNSPVPQINQIFNEIDGIRQRDDGSFYFEVKKGESSQSAGLRLERAGLIRTRHFWNLLARYEKEVIKSGTYKLDMPMSAAAIYRLFVSGRQTLNRVTIPEGVTLNRMARIFEQEEICSAEEFLSAARNYEIISEYNIPGNSLEGYLFPDTYFFPSNFEAELVIKTMLDQFFNKLRIIYPSYIEMTPRQLFEKIIIASIVEREYRIPDEAPLMSSVFYNRLEINMGLQSCATVEYIITEIMGLPHPGYITVADLGIDNRYNTYKWAGLPPGPISAPGEIALKAAFFPENTDYFFFRLENESTGKHIFSRTNEEHNTAGRIIYRSNSR